MHVYRPVNLTLYLQRPIFICKTKLCCLIIFAGGTKITRNSVMFLSDQKLLFFLSKAPPIVTYFLQVTYPKDKMWIANVTNRIGEAKSGQKAESPKPDSSWRLRL